MDFTVERRGEEDFPEREQRRRNLERLISSPSPSSSSSSPSSSSSFQLHANEGGSWGGGAWAGIMRDGGYVSSLAPHKLPGVEQGLMGPW